MNKPQVVRSVDRFLEKAVRQNKPLQGFRKTDQYSQFVSLMQKGITDQADYIAKELKKLGDDLIVDDYQPLTDTQQSTLKAWVHRFMPALTDKVSPESVFKVLKKAFEYSAIAQYDRWGIVAKADTVTFKLTNQTYIAKLKSQANYLLTQSSLDETTTEQIFNIISEGKMNGLTIDEISSMIQSDFEEIAAYRADMIARTETAQAMGSANYATMVENGVTTKRWITAGSNPCSLCIDNEADGDIPINAAFSSGDDHEPCHPNDECYTEGGEIDLDAIDVWSGA